MSNNQDKMTSYANGHSAMVKGICIKHINLLKEVKMSLFQFKTISGRYFLHNVIRFQKLVNLFHVSEEFDFLFCCEILHGDVVVDTVV